MARQLQCVKCKGVFFSDAPKVCNTCGLFYAPMGKVIAQNSHQSGDTYGVGMALVLDETSELLFLTSPEDKGCLEKLAYYAGLGVPKTRLIALVVCSESLDEEMKGSDLAELVKVATVYPFVVGTKTVKNKEVRAWDPNQLYQMIVNPNLFDRDKNKSQEEDRQVIKGCYEAAKLPYVAVWQRAKISDVGASTRLVGEKIHSGLEEFFDKVWTQVSLSQQRIDRDNLSERVAAGMVKELKKKSPSGVVLLWVRSLSGTELNELTTGLGSGERLLIKQRRKHGLQIDDIFWSLNANKRNPHHLMTPQLFETIRYVATRVNHAVIPIGDQVLFDEYLAAADKKKGALYADADENNLIGFWNRRGLEWFGGPERRVRQLFLLWNLFRMLADEGIPLVQIGLRSGEMEKAAYLGVPTIYLEEAASETGGRMLPVTVGGKYSKGEEPDTKAWWTKANTLQGVVSGKLYQDLKTAKSKAKGPGSEFWTGKVQTLTEQLEQGKQKVKELQSARVTFKEKQLNTFLYSVTDFSALGENSKGGLPFFFRLLTKNVVGLYGAGNGTEVAKVVEWLEETFEEDKPKSNCPVSLLRGTLTEFEIDLLYNVLLNIQTQFHGYVQKFLPEVD